MYSYHLTLEDDILRVSFNRQLPAQGDRLVKDTLEQLDSMIDRGELSGGRGVLKIDGPQSIPIAYVLAHRLAHLYEAIAVLDPKMGRKGYKTFIVVATHGSQQYQIGDLVEIQELQSEVFTLKVVLCGPPQVGKSCFREGLKQAIMSQADAPYPLVITACPDGEGSWFQQTYEQNEALARQMKLNNRGEFTPEFALKAAEWVRQAQGSLILVDVGGQRSPENQLIMAQAKQAIILYKTPKELQEWTNFCQSLGLMLVAAIRSELTAPKDAIKWVKAWDTDSLEKLKSGPLLTGVLSGLNRGNNQLSQRPLIQATSQLLLHLLKLSQPSV